MGNRLVSGRGHRLLAWARTLLNRVGLDVVRLHSEPWRFEPPDEFRFLRHLGIRTVIDVGANEGQFATQMRRLLPDAQILSFEPLPDVFERLVANCGGPRFRAFPIGIADREGTLRMFRSVYSQSSSFLRMEDLHKRAFPFSASMRESVDVSVQALDGALLGLNMEEGILLKIDVQGFEDKVIEGAALLLKKTKAVLIETSFEPLYRDQALFDDIYRTLFSKGFRFRGVTWQLRDPSSGGVLQADAVFTRMEGG